MLAESTAEQGGVNLHLNPFVALLLAVVAMVVLGVGLWLAFCAIARRRVGWKNLVQRFPVTETHKVGRTYGGQSGYFNRKSWHHSFFLRSMFSLELAREGFLVTAYFARRSPLFIPWSDICEVEEIELFGSATLHFSAYDEKEVQDPKRIVRFSLPLDALGAIQEHVPAELLHKTSSFAELIKNRLNGR